MAILDANEIFFTAFEPKQANRFIMYMDGVPSYIVKGVNAVTLTQGEVVLNHINVQRKVKGKTTWGDIQMTLFDPITPSGAQSVMEWVRLHHESVTGRDGYSDFYKKDLVLDVIDRNELIGQIYLQPTKTAEFIYLDFNITPTGATFPA